MSRMIRVAAIQQGPANGELAEEVKHLLDLLDQAAGQGAHLTTLCEVSLGPFFPNRLTRDYERYFVSSNDVVLKPFHERAAQHKMTIVLPFAERSGTAHYNSAMVIDASGNFLGTYRKTHIPAVLPSDLPGGTGSYEKFYFAPGDLGFPVFSSTHARIGVQICYDRKFPEGSRILAIDGAEIIAVPIAASTYGELKSRGDTWDLPMRARAYENGVFVVAANRVGNEGGRVSIGRSMVVSPVGEILAEGSTDREEIIICDVDLDAVATAQEGLPWWRDRRPELYGSLVQGVASPHA